MAVPEFGHSGETRRMRVVFYTIFWVILVTGLCVSFYATADFYITQTSPPPDNCTIAPDTALRILPLGDSITFGWGSSREASYRLDLLDFLQADCHRRNVTYIGSKNAGVFDNNENEGWPGYSITGLLREAKPAIAADLHLHPNVVLLHAGTNDCGFFADAEAPWEETAHRLGLLMDYVLGLSPNVTIIVAQIIATPNQPNVARIPLVNKQIPGEVQKRAKQGHKVFLVDMSDIGVDEKDLADKLHPSDIGYRKMAVKWLGALKAVSDKGWIELLEDSDG